MTRRSSTPVRLTLVDNEIDPTTGTVRLKATFPNARNSLWPGQFVNVRVLLPSRHDVVTLPSAAVEHGPNGLFTYVVKADSTVEARPIKTARGQRRRHGRDRRPAIR